MKKIVKFFREASWTKKTTAILIVSTFAIWIGWDIFAFVEATPGDTESEMIRNFSWEYPFFPFGVGVLMGHFFWNSKTGENKRWHIPVLVGLTAVFGVGGELTGLELMPIIPFLAGIPAGHYLWTQKSAKIGDDGNGH